MYTYNSVFTYIAKIYNNHKYNYDNFPVIFIGLYTANDVLLLMHEVIRMHEFAHPNIMSLIGVCFNPGVGIVMPFMTNGSVLSYLKKEKATLLLREAEEEVVCTVSNCC